MVSKLELGSEKEERTEWGKTNEPGQARPLDNWLNNGLWNFSIDIELNFTYWITTQIIMYIEDSMPHKI